MKKRYYCLKIFIYLYADLHSIYTYKKSEYYKNIIKNIFMFNLNTANKKKNRILLIILSRIFYANI